MSSKKVEKSHERGLTDRYGVGSLFLKTDFAHGRGSFLKKTKYKLLLNNTACIMFPKEKKLRKLKKSELQEYR